MQLFSEDELICFLEAESGLIWFDLPRDFHEPMTSSNVHRMFMPNSGQFIPEVPTFWNPKQTHVLGIVSFFVFFFFPFSPNVFTPLANLTNLSPQWQCSIRKTSRSYPCPNVHEAPWGGSTRPTMLRDLWPKRTCLPSLVAPVEFILLRVDITYQVDRDELSCIVTFSGTMATPCMNLAMCLGEWGEIKVGNKVEFSRLPSWSVVYNQ